jgi:hypothetical protein
MHEDILRAIRRLNKAEAFLRVEPLNRTSRHLVSPSSKRQFRRRGKSRDPGEADFWGWSCEGAPRGRADKSRHAKSMVLRRTANTNGRPASMKIGKSTIDSRIERAVRAARQ